MTVLLGTYGGRWGEITYPSHAHGVGRKTEQRGVNATPTTLRGETMRANGCLAERIRTWLQPMVRGLDSLNSLDGCGAGWRCDRLKAVL